MFYYNFISLHSIIYIIYVQHKYTQVHKLKVKRISLLIAIQIKSLFQSVLNFTILFFYSVALINLIITQLGEII